MSLGEIEQHRCALIAREEGSVVAKFHFSPYAREG